MKVSNRDPSLFYLFVFFPETLCLNVWLKLNLGTSFPKPKLEVGDKQDTKDKKVYPSYSQIYRLAKREQQMDAFVYNQEKTTLFVVQGHVQSC